MMKTQADLPDSLVFECDFEEAPEKVWLALTDPALLEAWLTTDALPVTHAGIESEEERSAPASQQECPAPATEQSGARNERPARQAGVSDCRMLAAEPHRFLRYRWRDREREVGGQSGREVLSVVTIELAPCPTGGTHLRLTHDGFRLVSAAPVTRAVRIVPIMSARRRRTPIVSFAARACLRRAA